MALVVYTDGSAQRHREADYGTAWAWLDEAGRYDSATSTISPLRVNRAELLAQARARWAHRGQDIIIYTDHKRSDDVVFTERTHPMIGWVDFLAKRARLTKRRERGRLTAAQVTLLSELTRWDLCVINRSPFAKNCRTRFPELLDQIARKKKG